MESIEEPYHHSGDDSSPTRKIVDDVRIGLRVQRIAGASTVSVEIDDDQKALCCGCIYAWRYRRAGGSQEVIAHCLGSNEYGGRAAQRVPSDIMQCSQFAPRQVVKLSINQMITMVEKAGTLIDTREGPPQGNAYL